LFYLKRNAPKKSGLVPVMCRITVNGKVAQFSCKLDVEERLWNVNLGRMGGRSITAQEMNRKFEKIRSEVNKAYQGIFDMDGYVTAEKVRNDYLGMGMTHKTLLAAFRQRIEDVEKLKGKENCNTAIFANANISFPSSFDYNSKAPTFKGICDIRQSR